MKRRVVYGILGALVALSPAVHPGIASMGREAGAAVAAALRDPAALIAGRSPGERGDNLVQSKGVVRVAFSDIPKERVLDETRERPVVPPEDVPGIVESLTENPEEIAGLPADKVLAALPPGGVIPGGRPPSILPPGGSSGGGSSGGGGGIPPGPTPTTPVSPVPEPSTWAMMIAGVFAAGAVLRRRSRPAAA